MTESVRERLLQALQEPAPTLAVAVSGGVDSLTLMALAARVRPGRCVAVHAVSPAVPEEATARVRALAARRAWRLQVIRAGEFSDPEYLSNPLERCYYCKTHLFQAMTTAMPGALLATGTNIDDLGDFRPGLLAARERGVWQPFVQLGVDKQTIRRIAEQEGLPQVAALPAQPCLASRIETGIAVSVADMVFVHKMERLLTARLGPGDHRCRITGHGVVAQTGSSHDADTSATGALAAELAALCEAEGRRFVSLEPYRRGSAFLHPDS